MKNFLLMLIAATLGVLLAAFLLFQGAVILATPEPLRVADSTVLVVDLSQPLSDRGAPGSLSDALGGLSDPSSRSPLPLRAAVEALHRAADDERIGAVLLTGDVGRDGLFSGWAALRELREGLLAVRSADKPVIAWYRSLDEGSYYLASLAEPAAMAPDGLFELNGFAAEVFYYAPALEKIGVEIQVTRVGKYKSAVEPYLLDRMSPENREQIQGFLDDLFQVFLDEVAAARGLTPNDLRELVERRGYLEAEDAVAAGLLDRAAYRDALLDELRETVGIGADDELPEVSLSDYASALGVGADRTGSAGSVAVVFVEGDLVDGVNDREAGGATVARRLRAARLDDEILAVVLRVNSPGGMATASEEILQEVRLMRGAGKPVVASLGSVAASGGYWVACEADEILAQPSTITGSIGVFGMFPNLDPLAEKLGVEVEVVKTGRYADAFSPFRARTEEEMAEIQKFVDGTYEDFLTRVSRGRGLDREAVHEIAQGRVWSGRRARELDLVDGFGTLEDAIRRAAERAGVESGAYGVDYREPEPSAWEEMLAQFAEWEPEPLTRSLGLPESVPLGFALRTLRLLGEGGVFARLPFDLSMR